MKRAAGVRVYAEDAEGAEIKMIMRREEEDGKVVEYTSAPMLIRFRIPEWMSELTPVIQLWNPNVNAWIEMETIVSPDSFWEQTLSHRTGTCLLAVSGVKRPRDCIGQAVLALEEGISISLPCGIADIVSLAPLAAFQLPEDFSADLDFISAFHVWILQDGIELSGADLEASFPLPDLYPVENLVFLHWQFDAWTELQTTATENRTEADGTLTSQYVLAKRSP
ncbi:MAG: hypothetical protein JXA25_16840 [Anaerolineales bacterium]|nr:hypothetical protein [Anaerolineales bacterium]